MKITKRQLRRIIQEEKAKLIEEQNVNPLRPHRIEALIKEAVMETVYDIVAENDLSDGMQIPVDTVQAIAQALRVAADEFTSQQGLS